MSYATFSDVLKRYNPLNTMIGSGTQDVSTTDISSIYIADAESLINAFLARTYIVPVTTEPLITQIACDIAIYKVLEDRAPRIPDFAATRYTNVMSLLMMLAQNKIVLTASGTAANSGGDEEAWSNNLDTPPVFSAPEANSWSFVNSPFCDG
jgi:phage gp36-like protein